MEIENERDFPLADERGKAGEGEKKNSPRSRSLSEFIFSNDANSCAVEHRVRQKREE